ncbi:Flp pilus assembly protein CpaB [Devosia sp.]|uniref:Flp pilus assembly protein CpaB n=1 Tax=Devosia sp. TaxID=1871048 RepID=UPI003A8E546C
MLRRVETIAFPAEAEAPDESSLPPAPASARPIADRRKTERRGMDQLRTEALQAVISQVEDNRFGGLRDRISLRGGYSRLRLAMVGIAVVAAGLAAFLSLQPQPAPPAPAPVEAPPPTVIHEPMTRVLVARNTVGIGQRLSQASLGWEDWPEAAVRAEFITEVTAPEAIEQVSGTLVRQPFYAGEPILPQKLLDEGSSYLASVLSENMRAVSVEVAAQSASGGFIVPLDRVDVILTRGSETRSVSETILRNVRVLAINDRLSAQPAGNRSAQPGMEGDDLQPVPAQADAEGPRQDLFYNTAIATLELDPEQSEMVTSAVTSGRLSLVLRPAATEATVPRLSEQTANQRIRMTSPFWTN